MTQEREIELIEELGMLRRNVSLSDISEENQKRKERIKEIMKELELNSKPRKNYVKCVYRTK